MNNISKKAKIMGSVTALMLLTSSSVLAFSYKNTMQVSAQTNNMSSQTSMSMPSPASSPSANANVHTYSNASAHTQNNIPSDNANSTSNKSAPSNHMNNNANHNTPNNFTAAQLRACTNRQAAIQKIIGNIIIRSQNQTSLFATIAARVETYYQSSGKKNVSNYAQLLASIQSIQVKTNTDLSTLKSNGNFNCNTINPKNTVYLFQGYLKQEIQDLQTYRRAVKNLIVAVATVNHVSLSATATAGGN